MQSSVSDLPVLTAIDVNCGIDFIPLLIRTYYIATRLSSKTTSGSAKFVDAHVVLDCINWQAGAQLKMNSGNKSHQSRECRQRNNFYHV